MAICQCMIHAFLYGWENDSYDERDLQEGIQYAKDLMQYEDLILEPFHEYDLGRFINWAEGKLRSRRSGSE